SGAVYPPDGRRRVADLEMAVEAHGHTTRWAASCWDQPQTTVAGRDKGQAGAIRGPAQCAVLARAAAEAPGWGRTISRPQPDGCAIVVGLLVQMRDRKGHQAPIGREARVRYPLHVEQVRRNHAASHTRLLLMATSSPQPCLTQPVKKAL